MFERVVGSCLELLIGGHVARGFRHLGDGPVVERELQRVGDRVPVGITDALLFLVIAELTGHQRAQDVVMDLRVIGRPVVGRLDRGFQCLLRIDQPLGHRIGKDGRRGVANHGAGFRAVAFPLGQQAELHVGFADQILGVESRL